MRSRLVILLLLVFAAESQAHRLDECLQATRIAVATNRIDISIDLTPGVAVFAQWILVIDRDHDGRISNEEATSYARKVLHDLQICLDGRPMTPLLGDVVFPPISDVREGVGVIRLHMSLLVEGFAKSPHEFSMVNRHLPAISVYLVNALVPKDHAIEITRQIRNEKQSNYRLLFTRRSTT